MSTYNAVSRKDPNQPTKRASSEFEQTFGTFSIQLSPDFTPRVIPPSIHQDRTKHWHVNPVSHFELYFFSNTLLQMKRAMEAYLTIINSICLLEQFPVKTKVTEHVLHR